MVFEDLGIHDISGILGEEIWCSARENNMEIMAFIVRAKAERDTKSFDRARGFQRIGLNQHKYIPGWRLGHKKSSI
jgi:hypothetical protein